MAALVVNNTVKMEWEKSHWVQGKGTKSQEGPFYLATKEYESTKFGTVTVGFTSVDTFLFADEGEVSADTLWDTDDMKAELKANPSDFPGGYSTCYSLLVGEGLLEFDDAKLEEYGLTAYKEDLVARRADIAQYATDDE